MSEETETVQDEPIMTLEIDNTGEDEAESAQAAAASAEEAPESGEEAAPEAPAEAAEEAPSDEQRTKGLSHRFLKLNEQKEREIAARREAEARADRERREKEAALALLKQLGHDAPASEASRAPTEADIEALVAQRAAEMAFSGRVNAMVKAGQKEFSDFDANCNTLVSLGVLPQNDATTLAAIMEGDAPQKVIQHLAGNVDEALEIAELPPVQRAARLAKLDAKLSAPPPKPAPKPVSRAPEPIVPISGTGKKGFDPNDESVPIDVWMEEMNKRDALRRKREQERGW